ncbi:MAG: PilZ domain-containing protein [Pseudomonadales bacterium]|jgi:type IV pilus assembly protein PilZ|nr:PilZ domain-containing protein [Pseudomonadales bacterium]MDP4639428.1 PilZ domain-containing protein [Pseudomonadales bacterium]MDP4764733.1 PilZ domain-containing protein [Pseudomonadales bacterium]MDP4876394.1 PilZ domain-containing protein [Pseudomonadales bacterium]MDP4911935.1 PilZ domain-containing protein [Pseudomonadales bacterium]
MGRLAGSGAKKTMIALTIKDKAVLHNCYMPFIKNGGLFIANRTEYEIGDDVFILLNLMDETEKIPVAGKVVWIAGKGVKSPHTPGVGIQFSDPENMAKDKIEIYLAGSFNSANATATM